MSKIKVLYSRENKEVQLPTKRYDDAGYDLYIDPVWFREEAPMGLILTAGETMMFPTGIRSVIPHTHYAQIQERGSTGTKAMKYGAGVIDASFRGIWKVVLTNCGNQDIMYVDKTEAEIEEMKRKGEDMGMIIYPISKGIAQFVYLEVPEVEDEEITPEELLAYKSERGEGMLGASGK